MLDYSDEAFILARVRNGVTTVSSQRDITLAAIPHLILSAIAHRWRAVRIRFAHCSSCCANLCGEFLSGFTGSLK